MAKKRSALLQKLLNLFKVSIFIARWRKPMIPRMISLKKSSWKLKKFKLLKHYNYGYIQEYEFSPSETPLIHRRHKHYSINKKSFRDQLYSMFFIWECLGLLKPDPRESEIVRSYRMDSVMALESFPEVFIDHSAPQLGIKETLESFPAFSEEDDDSVDERAERFIERFYEEIRRQRRESFMQINTMMDV